LEGNVNKHKPNAQITNINSCPLYHPPNGTLGLAALDNDTVDWLKRTVLNI